VSNGSAVIENVDFYGFGRYVFSTLRNEAVITIRYDTIGEFNVDWKAEYSNTNRKRQKSL